MRLQHPNRESRSTRHSAFMLVEVVMSFAILGLLFTALFSGLAWGFATVRWARENARATQVMLDKMEQFRLFKWDDVTSGIAPATFIEPFFETTNAASQLFYYTGTVTIASAPLNEPYANKMRSITVRVQWTTGGLSHTREISTLVAESGLQKYLF